MMGDFSVRGTADEVDADGRVPTATIERFLGLWDGIQTVDQRTFSAALTLAVDSRADGGTDLFGRMDPGVDDVGDGDTPVTMVVGDAGD